MVGVLFHAANCRSLGTFSLLFVVFRLFICLHCHIIQLFVSQQRNQPGIKRVTWSVFHPVINPAWLIGWRFEVIDLHESDQQNHKKYRGV